MRRCAVVVYAHDGLNTLVTTTEAAEVAGVTVSAISNWRRRGLIQPSGLDDRGKPLYRLADIVRTERSTRRRNWRPAPSPEDRT
jgi:hypothetical protein